MAAGNDWQFGKAAVEIWMNSPGHRTNVVEPRAAEVGVGVAVRGGVVVVVQMFGSLNSRARKTR